MKGRNNMYKLREAKKLLKYVSEEEYKTTRNIHQELENDEGMLIRVVPSYTSVQKMLDLLKNAELIEDKGKTSENTLHIWVQKQED